MGMRVPSITTNACPSLFAAASALRSFGARAASSVMVSRAYRQAVAVPTANPAARSRERLAVAQVNQDQQGLPSGAEPAPARANLDAVAADDPGHIGQGLGRQRQRSTVEKHGSPCVDDEDLAIASSTRGFTTLRAGTPTVINPCSSTQDQGCRVGGWRGGVARRLGPAATFPRVSPAGRFTAVTMA